MSYRELQKRAKAAGLKASGTASDISQRLEEWAASKRKRPAAAAMSRKKARGRGGDDDNDAAAAAAAAPPAAAAVDDGDDDGGSDQGRGTGLVAKRQRRGRDLGRGSAALSVAEDEEQEQDDRRRRRRRRRDGDQEGPPREPDRADHDDGAAGGDGGTIGRGADAAPVRQELLVGGVAGARRDNDVDNDVDNDNDDDGDGEAQAAAAAAHSDANAMAVAPASGDAGGAAVQSPGLGPAAAPATAPAAAPATSGGGSGGELAGSPAVAELVLSRSLVESVVQAMAEMGMEGPIAEVRALSIIRYYAVEQNVAEPTPDDCVNFLFGEGAGRAESGQLDDVGLLRLKPCCADPQKPCSLGKAGEVHLHGIGCPAADPDAAEAGADAVCCICGPVAGPAEVSGTAAEARSVLRHVVVRTPRAWAGAWAGQWVLPWRRRDLVYSVESNNVVEDFKQLVRSTTLPGLAKDEGKAKTADFLLLDEDGHCVVVSKAFLLDQRPLDGNGQPAPSPQPSFSQARVYTLVERQAGGVGWQWDAATWFTLHIAALAVESCLVAFVVPCASGLGSYDGGGGSTSSGGSGTSTGGSGVLPGSLHALYGWFRGAGAAVVTPALAVGGMARTHGYAFALAVIGASLFLFAAVGSAGCRVCLAVTTVKTSYHRTRRVALALVRLLTGALAAAVDIFSAVVVAAFVVPCGPPPASTSVAADAADAAAAASDGGDDSDANLTNANGEMSSSSQPPASGVIAAHLLVGVVLTVVGQVCGGGGGSALPLGLAAVALGWSSACLGVGLLLLALQSLLLETAFLAVAGVVPVLLGVVTPFFTAAPSDATALRMPGLEHLLGRGAVAVITLTRLILLAHLVASAVRQRVGPVAIARAMMGCLRVDAPKHLAMAVAAQLRGNIADAAIVARAKFHARRLRRTVKVVQALGAPGGATGAAAPGDPPDEEGDTDGGDGAGGDGAGGDGAGAVTAAATVVDFVYESNRSTRMFSMVWCDDVDSAEWHITLRRACGLDEWRTNDPDIFVSLFPQQGPGQGNGCRLACCGGLASGLAAGLSFGNGDLLCRRSGGEGSRVGGNSSSSSSSSSSSLAGGLALGSLGFSPPSASSVAMSDSWLRKGWKLSGVPRLCRVALHPDNAPADPAVHWESAAHAVPPSLVRHLAQWAGSVHLFAAAVALFVAASIMKATGPQQGRPGSPGLTATRELVAALSCGTALCTLLGLVRYLALASCRQLATRIGGAVTYLKEAAFAVATALAPLAAVAVVLVFAVFYLLSLANRV